MRISQAPEASMISFDDYGVNRRVYVVVDNGRRFYFDPRELKEVRVLWTTTKCKVEYTLSWTEYQNLKNNINGMNTVGAFFAVLGIVAFFAIFIVLASK